MRFYDTQPCPDCSASQFEDNLDRLGNATIGNIMANKDENVTFALRNDCDGATLQQGMVNYGTLIFVLLGIVAMNIYQKHMEVKYDEDEQTAQDYSIVIKNPPPDATDPEEWRLFFRYNFHGLHTTACTIAVDNDLLVRCLVKRRECMRKIEMKVEPGTSLVRSRKCIVYNSRSYFNLSSVVVAGHGKPGKDRNGN